MKRDSMKKSFMLLLLTLAAGCSTTNSGRNVLGLEWSPMWINSTTEQEKQASVRNLSLPSLCVEFIRSQSQPYGGSTKAIYIVSELQRRNLHLISDCGISFNPASGNSFSGDRSAPPNQNRRIRDLESENEALKSARDNKENTMRNNCVMSGKVYGVLGCK